MLDVQRLDRKKRRDNELTLPPDFLQKPAPHKLSKKEPHIPMQFKEGEFVYVSKEPVMDQTAPIRNNLTGLEGPYRIAQIIDGSVYRLIHFRGEEPIPPIKKNIPQEIPQPIKHLNTKWKKKMMKFLMTTTMTTLTSDMIRASVRYHKKALLSLCVP
jgi:hypothetical protein